MRKTLILILLAILGLTACSSAIQDLPLAEDKPTLLFFYTDGWPPWAEALPIVNRLQETYGEVEFVSLNAGDNAEGQSAFEQLTLLGHPAIVIFDADGQEVYRGFGTFDEDDLALELEAILDWK